MDSLELRLKSAARELGFSLCGIAPATEADTFPQFEAWLDAGHSGGMHYLEKHRDARRHPSSILASVRSVVMVALDYSSNPQSTIRNPQSGRVARYAQGPDYHRILWDKLDQLAAWLQEQIPCECRGVVDTAPLLERDFARRAGLGWFGKNTMLINPNRGSYFFLAALLTSLELTVDVPFATNHCGTCTACLDACPTQAFPQPGTLDATKCISYLTIEHRGSIARDQHAGIGDWLFGCDVCQEVCPWNRFAGIGSLPHDESLESLDCHEILAMTEEQFRERFRGTALTRTKWEGLRRNAEIVLENANRRFHDENSSHHSASSGASSETLS